MTLLSDAGEDTVAAEAAGADDTELVEVTAALNQGGSADGKMEDPEMQREHSSPSSNDFQINTNQCQ